jgi:hypothetical protein
MPTTRSARTHRRSSPRRARPPARCWRAPVGPRRAPRGAERTGRRAGPIGRQRGLRARRCPWPPRCRHPSGRARRSPRRPVMATTCPWPWSAFTIACFCFGLTRPNTVVVATASATSSRVSPSVRASTGVPTSSPTRAAMAATVVGLSPEITLICTPCPAKYRNVSRASGRTCSARVHSATARRSSGRESPMSGPSTRCTARTRRPVAASSSTSGLAASSSPRSTSGAPSNQLPCSPKVVPLHFRAELKGTSPVTDQPSGASNAAASAARLALASGVGERSERGA